MTLRVNSLDKHVQTDVIYDTAKYTSMNKDECTTSDSPTSILLGCICSFISFIVLLICRFIIMYGYPDTMYIQFHLNLSGMDPLTPDTTTTYQVRTFDEIDPIITMRYTSCDINDETQLIEDSYQDHPYGQSLMNWMEAISHYGQVCTVAFRRHAWYRV